MEPSWQVVGPEPAPLRPGTGPVHSQVVAPYEAEQNVRVHQVGRAGHQAFSP
jgi:hypothetical protein